MNLPKYISTKAIPLILMVTLVFLLFIRFYKIDEVPTAFVHDELIYVMQAKSLSLTGSDMSGNWSPFSLEPFDIAFAELPSVIMSIGSNLTSNPVINGKIIHIIIGLLLPFVLGWVAYGFWESKQITLVTVVLASLNPWLWQFSRMTFDSLLSIFFYLIASGIVLTTKGWWKLFSLPFLFLGFYQYQGLKLIFLTLVVSLVAYAVVKENLFPKKFDFKLLFSSMVPLLCILLFSIVLFSHYFFVSLPQQTASRRLSQIILFDKEFIVQEVTSLRQLGIDSPVQRLISNKYTVVTAVLTKNLLKVLNPSFMFFSANEAANPFVTTNHGYFYLIDIILIFLGMHFLLSNTHFVKRNYIYGLLLLTSLLPAIITIGQSYSFRASFFYMLLIPLAACGLVSLFKHKKTFVIVLFIYALSTLHFGYHYFYQYPVYAADGQFFAERVLASYIDRLPKDKKVIVYSVDQKYLFNSYLFYNNLYTFQTESDVREAITSQNYTFGNVEFRDNCVNVADLNSNSIIITTNDPDMCEIDGQSVRHTSIETLHPEPLTVPAIKDSGELYKIYGDQLCKQYTLPTYISPQKTRLFAVESLSNQEFCTNWITNLNPLRTPTPPPNIN